VGELIGGNPAAVEEDIRAVVAAVHDRGGLVKVILETGLLSDPQKRLACECARIAGADFVKTSTGFGPGGATIQDVKLLRAAVGSAIGVKASGGIRTLEDYRAMMAAGANRIGASAGVAILESITE
jgi:deoxyribose-phosphate aldolase